MNRAPLIALGFLLFSAHSSALETASPQQAAAVQQATEHVIPFDVDKTLQTFTKTVHGGIQHVVVKSADNVSEIKQIQAFLLKQANDFRKGDFSVTERIHGKDMPGLAPLKKAGIDDIRYEYQALGNGAQIHYSTEYPMLVQALHEWFDAQAKSHPAEVIPQHSQHHSTANE